MSHQRQQSTINDTINNNNSNSNMLENGDDSQLSLIDQIRMIHDEVILCFVVFPQDFNFFNYDQVLTSFFLFLHSPSNTNDGNNNNDNK